MKFLQNLTLLHISPVYGLLSMHLIDYDMFSAYCFIAIWSCAKMFGQDMFKYDIGFLIWLFIIQMNFANWFLVNWPFVESVPLLKWYLFWPTCHQYEVEVSCTSFLMTVGLQGSVPTTKKVAIASSRILVSGDGRDWRGRTVAVDIQDKRVVCIKV